MGHCRRCRKCVNPRIRVGIRKEEPENPPDLPPEEGNPAAETAGKDGQTIEEPEKS